MTSNIKSIASPSHPINFEFGDSPKKATVKLSSLAVRTFAHTHTEYAHTPYTHTHSIRTRTLHARIHTHGGTHTTHTHSCPLQPGTPLTKDFEISATLTDPHEACVRIQNAPAGKKVAFIGLNPKMDDDDVSTEMIFIVDRSGSMAGSSMQSVKDTLHIFLRSIPVGCFFNIVGFGSTWRSLFPDSVAYNGTLT